MFTEPATIKQRSELTFKYNSYLGRHGWLRLTPAYSVKIVDRILNKKDRGLTVIDPFSGTGTTPLCAAYRDFPAVSVDVNPFLVWLGRVKTDIYSEDEIMAAGDMAVSILDLISSNGIARNPLPSIHNIERWWAPSELTYLSSLKTAIDYCVPANSNSKNLLLLAFCRLLIKLSNAAFNHQSMSFKEKNTQQLNFLPEDFDFDKMFLSELGTVLFSARENPGQTSKIIKGDARNLDSFISTRFDLLITSPPYPNRISYIRELRPYMYWLGYLTEARQAGELDWEAIGGTWGIATSRLSTWERNPAGFYPLYFKKLLDEIAKSENKNGSLLANYVAKYFEDMWKHLKSVNEILSNGAEIHYIIGNSVFYDVLVPVEQIYKDMFGAIGFKKIKIDRIRKRNSKKALYEFDVNGVK
jgi:hypothetical protein